MDNSSVNSYLDKEARNKGVPIGSISNSPHAIAIYKKTLEEIINLLYEPSTNPAEDFTATFLDIIRKDIARISQGLRKYEGSKPSRDDIKTAKSFLDEATNQMSVVAKHLKRPPKDIQEDLDRVNMLSRCRGNLENALEYFLVFLFVMEFVEYFCFDLNFSNQFVL